MNPNAAVQPEQGRAAAALVWLLYILSIPSVAILVPIGVIVAYVARGSSGGWVRSHFDAQIRLFWAAFWWAVALGVLTLISWALTVVLIGFPLLALWAIAGFVVFLWFTIKSVFGLLAIVRGRPA